MDNTNEPVNKNSTDQNIVSIPTIRREQEIAPLSSVIRSSEPEMPGELKEFGVDVINQHQPNLTAEHQQAGISYSLYSAPVPTQYSSLQLPTREEAAQLSKGPIDNSGTWFGKLLSKLFKKSQQMEGVPA